MYKVYVLLNTLRSLPELLTFVDKFKPGTAWNNNINREADCVTKLQVYVTLMVCVAISGVSSGMINPRTQVNIKQRISSDATCSISHSWPQGLLIAF